MTFEGEGSRYSGKPSVRMHKANADGLVLVPDVASALSANELSSDAVRKGLADVGAVIAASRQAYERNIDVAVTTVKRVVSRSCTVRRSANAGLDTVILANIFCMGEQFACSSRNQNLPPSYVITIG